MKTSIANTVAAALSALMLFTAGCKSSSDGAKIPPTQSGFPEVVVPSRTIEQLQATVREFFKNRGYIERESRHAYEQVFDKAPTTGKADKALRVVIRAQQEPKGACRLIGIPMGVEGWRGSLESAVVVPQGKVQIQAFLDQIKAQATGAP